MHFLSTQWHCLSAVIIGRGKVQNHHTKYMQMCNITSSKVTGAPMYPGKPPPISNMVKSNPNDSAMSKTSAAASIAAEKALASPTPLPTWKLKEKTVSLKISFIKSIVSKD